MDNAQMPTKIWTKEDQEQLFKQRQDYLHSIVEGNFPDLYHWLSELNRFIDVKQFLQVIEPITENDHSIHLCIYTSNYIYSICARHPFGEDSKGYLGCLTSNRKRDVGESWGRGRDLADGEYNYDTWDKILKDIIAYELKPLSIWSYKIEKE